MPGYELDRFVNISETEKSELLCSICHNIFHCPVVTQCCLQSFCEDCINDWLTSNNTCPYDKKKTLTNDKLFKAPRALINMLGKLKIRCEFKKCKEVLFLEDITQHTVNCRYNPENRDKKCENCLCEYPVKSSHDCIKALLGKIREFETEKENFLKTIQDLSKNNIARTSQISDYEVINRAKEHLWNPEIIQNDMEQDKKDKVLTIVRDQLKDCKSLYVMCKSIKANLEDEFGYSWNCFVTHQEPIISCWRYESGHLISLKFGELYMKIFKTGSLFYPNLRQRLINNKIKREIQIIETDMKQNMISEVKKIIFDAIEKCDMFNNVPLELRQEMEKSYPGNWQCFCFAHFGTFHVWRATEKFIRLKIDCLEILLFKAGVGT